MTHLEIIKKRGKWLIPALLIYALYALFFGVIFKGHYSCILKELFGIPCPGCGQTRAYKALFTGHILKAFYYHPLFWLTPIVCYILIFHEVPLVSKIYKRRWFWLLIGFVYLLTYIIRMILYFPSSPMEIGTGLFQRLFNL